MQIDSDLAQLRAINRKWGTFAEAFHRYGAGIGAKPVTVTAPAALAEERRQTAQFCAPLLPASGGRS